MDQLLKVFPELAKIGGLAFALIVSLIVGGWQIYNHFSKKKNCCDVLSPQFKLITDKFITIEESFKTVILEINKLQKQQEQLNVLILSQHTTIVKDISTTISEETEPLVERVSSLSELLPVKIKLSLESDLQYIRNYISKIDNLEIRISENIKESVGKDIRHMKEINEEFKTYVKDSMTRIFADFQKMITDLNSFSRDITGISERDKNNKDSVQNIISKIESLKSEVTSFQHIINTVISNRSNAGF